MSENNTFEKIRNTIRQEKLGKITSWLFQTEDPDTHTVAVGRLIADGVLAENVRRIFLHFLEQELPSREDDRNPLHSGVEEKQIEVPELLRLLDKSISFTFDYLIIPERTLYDFLLEGKQELTIGANLYSKLDSIGSYDYFPVLLGEWFTRLSGNGQTTISGESLQAFIKNTDELILHNATISTTIELLDPMYDFFNYRIPSPVVETELLSVFFKEKGLDGIAGMYSGSAKTLLTMREAVDILTDSLVKHGGERYGAQTKPETLEPDFHSVSIPEYNDFLQDLKTAGVRLPEPKPETEDYHLLPFEFFIGKKLRTRTIEKIFYGDETAYRNFLLRIDSIKDKDQAFLTLDTMIELQRGDLTSKTAVRLQEALQNRFAPDEENT